MVIWGALSVVFYVTLEVPSWCSSTKQKLCHQEVCLVLLLSGLKLKKHAFYRNYWLGSNKPRIILFSCFAELYEFCLKEGYADKNLIAKWKKQGYENLCCLRCIQCRDTNFGTNCICRVPKSKLEEGKIVECVICGCRGCSG